MVLQLLWLELIVKAVTGGLLVLFPRTLARILGLPAAVETFWPRLLGATFVEGQLTAGKGLGLAGHVAINLAAVLAILGLLIMGRAGSTRRGRIILTLAAAALTVLALVELAYV
jgi:hypothetical protein